MQKKIFLLIALLCAVAQGVWADAVTLQDDNGTKYVNMPTTGTNKLTLTDASVTTFKVYDNGGKDSNYSDNCDGTLVLTAPDGYELRLTGTVKAETAGNETNGEKRDYLQVYDGGSTSANLLGMFGEPLGQDVGTLQSGHKQLTLNFKSDNSSHFAGLDLTVTVIDIITSYNINGLGTVTGGTLSATVDDQSTTTAKLDETVTLTATPATDYLLTGISVVDGSSNTITVTGGTWYNNTATFTMPGSAVTVTPTFTDDLTASSLSVNMPAWDTKTLTIPTGVQSFKVYDDGGPSGYYSDNCNGTLVLTAPEGYVLQLSGGIDFRDVYHYMYVYDGGDNQANTLIDGVSASAEYGIMASIPTVISTGRNMTVFFRSTGGSSYHAGLDLTVTLINTNTQYAINGLEASTNGTIVAKVNDATVAQAKFRDEVTLTATPDDGYILSNLSVTDVNSNAVSVNWPVWTNTATFTMPIGAVTVNPTFTSKNSLSINMPKTNMKTVTIPTGVQTFKVYDDGGNGNYSDGCDGTLVLTAPSGYVLQLSGNITAGPGDYLTVYDNNEASGTKLIDEATSSGMTIDATAISTVTSTGNSMTLYFYSDGANNYDGLDLTVLVYNPTMKYDINGLGNTTNGSIAATVGGNDATTAKWKDVVTLTAAPAEGYVLSNISVVDANSNAVSVNWPLWTNTATFTMPLAAVTVTPTFTSKNSLSINMPVTDTKTVTIPAGVESFKVYDDGGSNGNYSDNCDGTLVLTAPQGYRLELSGTIYSNSNDNLSVYDGNDKNATILINEMHSPGNAVIETATIPTVISTGQSMTLYFHSNSDYNLDGLDLTVRVIDASAEYNINGLGTVDGCSIAAAVGVNSVTKAKASDVVTLTATPAAGYALIDLSVVTNSETVTVTRDFWANTAIFTMPASAVTVTPTFANNLSVNMPKTDERTIQIPSNVSSFKVYDDGGSESAYSSSCDGTLILNAPEGRILKLSGSIITEADKDKLFVYNGSSNSAPVLINGLSGETNIPTVFSTGQSMTIYFSSDDANGWYAGLDLTVTVLDPDKYYDIIGTGNTGNGSIAATVGNETVTQAKLNDVVTLTATPADGYVLDDLSVTDANSQAVNTNWNLWSNTATFTMPHSAVTVTPTFTSKANLSINMPVTGTKTVAIPAGVESLKVYDDGGSSYKYSSRCNGTLVLTAPEGCVLRLSGNIETTQNVDRLFVYDGSNNSASALVQGVSGTTNISATGTGQSMTINFQSDADWSYESGLNLTVTVIDPNAEYAISGIGNVMNGSITASVGSNDNATQAKEDDEVTLTVSPVDGYVLNELSVVDASSNAVSVNWNLWANIATFTMPASAVTVNPTFIELANLYINMPATGTKTVTVPASVQSFKVYDDGGSGGDYSSYCSGTLVLTAPEGYLLQLSGSIRTVYNQGQLTVYDGSSNSASKLIDGVSGESTISTVISTGQNMTLYFYSNYTPDAGFDLTVTLINTNAMYAIGFSAADGGSIAATVANEAATQAKWKDEVTLTATPTDGYVLSELSVTDANSNAVDVTWDFWSNTATFTMPLSAVTVTPMFTNDVYVNMPATGERTILIPSNVSSFKVYDDGGSSSNYSDDCDGTLVLTAPEGCLLQLSGSIETEQKYDKLFVYDGSNSSAPALVDGVSGTTNISATSTVQSMTIKFSSDYSSNRTGLNLTVTVIDPNAEYAINGLGENTNGSIAATVGGNSASQAKANNVVTLTATPSPGYVLGDLSIIGANSNAVEVTRDFWANTATFTMPASAVTVTPTFTNNPYINMPAADAKTVAIPAGIRSLRVYDDGGPDNNYSAGSTGTMTLTAPEGYRLQLSGRIDIGSDGHFTVYDGSDNECVPFNGINWVSESRNLPTVTSSGQSITFYFSSYGSYSYPGLNLTVKVVKVMELANNADNSTSISNADGYVANVTLAGRTLYKDGDWNTICLPFNVGDSDANNGHYFDGTPLEGATVMVLGNSSACNTGFDAATGTLNLEFLPASEIEAGVAYIVKWEKDTNYDATPSNFDIANPVFCGVTIVNEDPADRSTVSEDGCVKFTGSYSSVSIAANDKTVLYLGAGNTLYYPNAAMQIGSCRAHFQLNGITAGDKASTSVRAFNLNFGDGETTGIVELKNSRIEELKTDAWYSLDGRKLNGKPTRAGLYIVNGKKVVIK